MQKNVTGQKLCVYVFDSTTNLPKTGDAANLTAYVNKDWAGVNVLSDTSATEVDSTNAKGFYIFDLSQTETNGDALLFSCRSATANMVCVAMPAVVFTTPANFATQSIDSNGRIDVIKVAGTTQTARDIGASVLLSSGTGTGQLDFTSGVVKANVTQLLGTAWLTPGTAGTPDVNVKLWNGLTTVALPLIPTVAGRTLDVSAGGEAGVDWANVGSPTTTVDLSGTTIKTTQKVDVDTIKTNPVVNGGTITFPTNATVASTTNITAGTVTTATNVTTVNGLAAGVITATSIAADAITAAKVADGTIDAATFAAGAIDAAAIAADAIGASELAADAVAEIQSGLSTLTAAGVRSAVGLASANLDTLLAAIAGYIDTEIGTIISAISALGSPMQATDKTGFKLADDGLDLVDVAGIDLPTALVYIGATCAGVVSGAGTNTESFKDFAGNVVVVVTADEDGNRSAVAYG